MRVLFVLASMSIPITAAISLATELMCVVGIANGKCPPNMRDATSSCPIAVTSSCNGFEQVQDNTFPYIRPYDPALDGANSGKRVVEWEARQVRCSNHRQCVTLDMYVRDGVTLRDCGVLAGGVTSGPMKSIYFPKTYGNDCGGATGESDQIPPPPDPPVPPED